MSGNTPGHEVGNSYTTGPALAVSQVKESRKMIDLCQTCKTRTPGNIRAMMPASSLLKILPRLKECILECAADDAGYGPFFSY